MCVATGMHCVLFGSLQLKIRLEINVSFVALCAVVKGRDFKL